MLSKDSSRFNLGLTGVWTSTYWSWAGTYDLRVSVPAKFFLLVFFLQLEYRGDTNKDKAPQTLDELIYATSLRMEKCDSSHA